MIMNSSLAANMITAMHAEVNALLGAAAVIQCWDGTPPPTIGSSDAGTMIAEIACSNPAFNAVVAGVAPVNTTTDDTNTAAGTVAYWRMRQSTAGTTIFQWTEGVDFVTDDPAFGAGDTCHIGTLDLTYTITPPDA